MEWRIPNDVAIDPHQRTSGSLYFCSVTVLSRFNNKPLILRRSGLRGGLYGEPDLSKAIAEPSVRVGECGFIDEFTIEDSPTKRYDRVKGFYCRCGPVLGISKEYAIDGYDYFEFEVPYNIEHKFPKSYGGMSGGGVWQVELIRTPEGALAANTLILSGVAFYESDVLNQKRSIKCHGRQSIYQAAVEAILSKGE